MKKAFIIAVIGLVFTGASFASLSNAYSSVLASSENSSLSCNGDKEFYKTVPSLLISSEYGFAKDNVKVYYSSETGKYYLWWAGNYHEVVKNPYSSYKGHNVSSYTYCCPMGGSDIQFFNI